jgi:hypothetical protein
MLASGARSFLLLYANSYVARIFFYIMQVFNIGGGKPRQYFLFNAFFLCQEFSPAPKKKRA